MYRRVNSGRWIGVTTALIVVVMAVFTWVMYGMARQVFTMTDVMLELNESIKTMVGTQVSMADDIGQMAGDFSVMNGKIIEMNDSISEMNGSVSSMNDNMATMTSTIGYMGENMGTMANNMNRMTYDLNQAVYAISNPMSFMFGNAMPF